MAASDSYLFLGSNIGPRVTFDTVNIPEMMYMITKKIFGIPNTIPDAIYRSEIVPSKPEDIIGNAFPHIYQNKIYSQNIPIINPMGNFTITIISGISYYLPIFAPEKTILDVSWSNYNYSNFYLVPILNDNLSKRYVSKTHPHLCFYSNLLLSPLCNYYYRFPNSRYPIIPTYIHPLLVNSISPRHNFTYFNHIFRSNGINRIQSTDGFPIIDNDTGVVIFYDSNTASPQVTPSNPPRMSFYRYEGLFGEASILQGQDL